MVFCMMEGSWHRALRRVAALSWVIFGSVLTKTMGSCSGDFKRKEKEKKERLD